jgi:hypothetical protein
VIGDAMEGVEDHRIQATGEPRYLSIGRPTVDDGSLTAVKK